MILVRTSDEYVATLGMIGVVREVFESMNFRLDNLFHSCEAIHDMLARYESKASTNISHDIKNQCLHRYGQYKGAILSDRQFITKEMIRKHFGEHAIARIEEMRKYGLHVLIEKAYLHLDFATREIHEEAKLCRGGYARVYRPVKHMNGLVLVKNNKDRRFVIDKEKGLGFPGDISGKQVTREGWQCVTDDEFYTFAIVETETGTTYELL